MESEVLGNLAAYDRLAEKIDIDELVIQDVLPVLSVFEAMLDHYPVEGVSLVDSVRLCKVIDVLIHRYVYLEQTYGTEQEFKQMIKKIIYSLLK